MGWLASLLRVKGSAYVRDGDVAMRRKVRGVIARMGSGGGCVAAVMSRCGDVWQVTVGCKRVLVVGCCGVRRGYASARCTT